MRWVICGNYESRSDQESNFSSGADSTAFRVMLVMCARNQWQAGTLDVKTAFLNAFIDQESSSNLIIVKPPSLLVEKG